MCRVGTGFCLFAQRDFGRKEQRTLLEDYRVFLIFESGFRGLFLLLRNTCLPVGRRIFTNILI